MNLKIPVSVAVTRLQERRKAIIAAEKKNDKLRKAFKDAVA